RFSPDGRTVSWLGAEVPEDGTQGTIWLADASGSGKPRALNAGREETAYDARWLPGGDLLVTAVSGTRCTLTRRGPDGAVRGKPVGSDGPVFLGTDVDARGDRFVLAGNTRTQPSVLWTGSARGGKLRVVSDPNPQLAGVAFGQQETIRWKAKDGLEI